MKDESVLQRPSFIEAVRFWFKLGWISFGGTAGHIAIMHDYLVDKRRWISNSLFFHALSFCMLLPGPEAQQLAIYIGWKLHGKKGGLIAGSLFVLPSMLILLALSIVYVVFGNQPWLHTLFSGLKPAVIAIIILALYKVGQKALRGPLYFVVAIFSFGCIFFYNVSLIAIICGTIVLALIIRWVRPSLLRKAGGRGAEDGAGGLSATAGAMAGDAAAGDVGAGGCTAEGYAKGDAIAGHAVVEACAAGDYSTGDADRTGGEAAGLSLKRVIKEVAIFLFLWLIPFFCFFLFSNDFSFWKTLTLFFTKTAFFTIGGSYTVLPYVAQIAVSKLNWLTKLQMVDGFALAETTPGPLIIVVAFVGFMGGFNYFHGSILMGAIALVTTTFYTFLPCFLFIFAGGPVIEKTHSSPAIESILGLVTAAVVGVILNLTLFLGKEVVFPGGVSIHHLDLFSLGWIVVSLVLLLKFRMNIIYLILLSFVFGFFVPHAAG